MLLGAQGFPDEGIALIEQAIARQPQFPVAWFNRGTILAAQTRHQAALDSVLHALAQEPEHAGSLAVAGRALQALGRDAEAAAMLARAVAAQDVDAMLWNDYGVALTRCGHGADAVGAYRNAVRLMPDYAPGYANLGAALLAQGALAEADAAFASALRLDPANRHPSRYRGMIAAATGQAEQALLFLGAALDGGPNDAAVLALRGALHWERLDLEAAEADLDQALVIAPGLVGARIDRGNVFQDRGDFVAALAAYDRALAIEPDNITALNNRGTTLQALHRAPEALASFDQALATGTDRSDVMFSRGICLLRMGRWQEGWDGFEARWRPWTEALAGFSAPRWDGVADLASKRILVAGEQGLGDMIQFSRFAPRLTTLGARVIVSVDPPLQRMMLSLDGVDGIAGPHDTPEYDLFCLMMSLPALLRVDESGCATAGPYLRAEDRDVAAWRARLSPYPGLKVGLVWAGDPRPGDRAANAMDRRRSVPLRALVPLLGVPGVTFVSLQKGAAAGQAVGAGVLDWSGDLHDFADTAALMTALDLVISVDTSVVHAAGALGRPVWVLNRYDACWRWGRGGAAWYPSLRLFTQAAPGDWDGVIARVGMELGVRASAHKV